MSSLLPLNDAPTHVGKGRTQPRHGRGGFWCRAGTSLVLTYASFSLFVKYRQHRKIEDVAYPMTDEALIQLVEDDLSVWTTDSGRSTKTSRSRTGKKRPRPSYTTSTKKGEANADADVIGTGVGTVKGRGRPTYHIPGSDNLREICPKYECTVVHIDTRPSSKQRELVRFVNQDFDHLRLLWYGCSLNRAASKLHREGIHVNGYFVINVGDAYIEEGKANFPVWSKGSPVRGGEADGTLDVMMPYEELLWSYPAGDLTTPFAKKKATAVYRGGCTHPRRAEMVDAVQQAFPPPASDAAVSCRPNFTSLSPKEQGKYRCLLDYDGNGYSRRMAWYLQTGGVVMRGGNIDDVLSRIARNRNRNGRGKEAPPVLFWNWNEKEDGSGANKESTNDESSDDTGLISTVRKCISDDIYAQDVSNSALDFWSKYVQEGAVWDGFLAHLIVEQSRRLILTLNEDEFNTIAPNFGLLGWTRRHTVGEPLFQSLSQSNLVCSVVFDAVTPTGQSGRPQWGYIITCIVLCCSVLSISFSVVTPSLGQLVQKSIKKTISSTAAAAGGRGHGGKSDVFVRVASHFGLAPKCR